MRVYLNTNWISRSRNPLNRSKSHQGWCLSLFHCFPIQAFGDKKAGEDSNARSKTRLSRGAPIINSINGRWWPMFLTSVLLLSDGMSKQYHLKEMEEECKGTKAWKMQLHVLPSIFIVFILVLEMPANYTSWPMSPLGTLFPHKFSCLIHHASSFSDFLIQNSIPNQSYSFTLLYFHPNSWHHFIILFNNLFMASGSHWNMWPTRAGILPTALLYPPCLEQKLASNELPVNICWLNAFHSFLTLSSDLEFQVDTHSWVTSACFVIWMTHFFRDKSFAFHFGFPFWISFW